MVTFVHRLLIFLFLFFPALLCQAADRGPEGIVRVGIFPFEPLNFIDEKGDAQGLYPDLLREIVRDEKWGVEFIPGSWAEGLERLHKGEIDLILSVAYTPERAEAMDFTFESVAELWSQVFLKPNSKIQNINSLDGHQVAVMREDINGRNFIATAENLGIYCAIDEYSTHDEVFAAVQQGIVDAGVAPQHFGLRHAKRYNVIGSSIMFSPFSIYFASKKGEQHELLSHIDAHLNNWKREAGSFYYERLDYWLGSRTQKTVFPIWLIYVALIGVVAILVFSGFSIMLKRKVNSRTKELQKSEKDLQASQRIARLGSWRLELATNEVVWTEELYKMYGFDPNLPVPPYTEHMKLFTQESWERLATSLAKTSETGIPYELELETVRKDKSKGWMWVRGEAEKNQSGEIVGLWGAAQDITDRKKMEQGLRKSERRYRSVLQTAIDGFWIVDTNGYFLEVNPAYVEMSGYSERELLTMHISDIEVSETPEDVTKHIKKGITNGYDYFESIHRRKDNSIYPVEVSFNYSEREGGRFIVFVKDISVRKEAEEKTIRLKERLESLWSITKIADSEMKVISDSVLVEVQKMTQSQYAFYGFLDDNENEMVLHAWSRETMEDCRTDARTLHFAIDKAGIWAEAVRERKILTINDFTIDHPAKKGIPDGHVPLTRLMVVPYMRGDNVVSLVAVANKTSDYLEDDEEQVSAFMRSVQLLIDRRTAQQEAAELATHLQQAQKMEAIGTLAGGIAHDFNNILSAILGFTELAIDTVNKETPVKEDLQEVLIAGMRAKELVNQILIFARQSEEEMKPIQVGLIVRESLKFMRSSIPTTIDIKQNIETDSMVMGNATQLHQVILNLCTNASQAMDEDGGTLEISLKDVEIGRTSGVDKLKAGNYIEITVSDTGSGIEPHIISRIFEPYFTTKKQGEGTGMGLALVHGIVESYGGKISADSKTGKGTIFTIYLPTCKSRKAKKISHPEDLPVGKERILLVDDEVQITKTGSRILGQLGYSVTPMTDSLGALELFRSKPDAFDLVLSDVSMPGMAGDVFAHKLMEIRPDIPVVLATGYSKKVSEENALENGVKAFIEKPIVKADMARIVRKVLDEVKSSHV